MGTTAQRFYTSDTADDQTFSGENQIRRFDEASNANVSNTVTWTTTTRVEKTVIPGSNHSTSGDSSMNNGFAFQNGGAIGLESTANARRWIKPGVWTFAIGYSINTPALLDAHDVVITAKVYRVAAGGGTRTLLFTASTGSLSGTGSQNAVWNSASQPEYILEAGEVLMVGFTCTTASTTALVLGANTNTVIAFFRGNSACYVQVPAPGIRTLGIGGFSADGAGSGAAVGMSTFSGVAAGGGSAAAQAVATGVFSGVFDADGVATAAAIGASRASTVFDAAGSADAQAIGNGIFSGVFDAVGSSDTDAVGAWTFSGMFSADGSSASDWSGGATFSGVFAGAGVAESDLRMSAVAGTVFSAQGAANSDWRQTNLFSGVFAASGEAITYVPATAIFSGVFDADGSAATEAFGTGIFSGVFAGAGAADSDYRGSSVAGTVFAAEGAAATDIRLSVVLGAVFEADVSQGGGETVVIRRPIYLFDD